jgi:hypothetical protein
MDKPDPYADWVLFGTNEGPAGSALEIDEELLAAARGASPRVLAHVRGKLFDKGLGAERTELAESAASTSYIQSGILPSP